MPGGRGQSDLGGVSAMFCRGEWYVALPAAVRQQQGCGCCLPLHSSPSPPLPPAAPTCTQGDRVEIIIITRDGVKKDELQLKKD